MQVKERDMLIWLNNLDGVNNRYLEFFNSRYGSLEDLWGISSAQLDKLSLNRTFKESFFKCKSRTFYQDIMSRAEMEGVKIITIRDKDYPERLRSIEDPPVVLYSRGDITKSDSISISIVGPRKPSPYGIYTARKLANEIAELGITIVSGMASGVDTLAHIEALKSGSRTIAVLGTGADVIYPASNRSLYWKIAENGAVVSEFPLGTKGLPRNFPQRNRIISGLSLGTVIVEAAQRSGTLITARHALEQGREVFAVPGNINSIYSKGTNGLIRDGAKLVEGIDDIVDELLALKALKAKKAIAESSSPLNGLGPDEIMVVKAISTGPKTADEISREVDMSIVKINSVLTVLELKGRITRLKGSRFST